MLSPGFGPDQVQLHIFNASTASYGVNPLPPNAIAVDGSRRKDAAPIYDGVVIYLLQPNSIGQTPLMPFIYGIMAGAILLIMTPFFAFWLRDATMRRKHLLPGPVPALPPITKREFARQLKLFYPSVEVDEMLKSFAETVGSSVIHGDGDVTSTDLRACRELMRAKYARDLEIWSYGEVRPNDRPIVDNIKRQSEGILWEIQRIADRWQGTANRPGPTWTQEEWQLVAEIRERISSIPRGQYGRLPPARPRGTIPQPYRPAALP